MSEYQIRQQQMEAERKFHAHFQINGYIEQMKALESENERLREALEDIIPTAESYAMQTYDRGGCTRRVIEQAKSALEGEKLG